MKAAFCLSLAAVFLMGCGIGYPPVSTPVPAAPAASAGPASCSAGQEWCQGSCVDTIQFMNDDRNCGRCGNSCSYSQACTGGFCQCGPGYDSCMGQCKSQADYISDSQNCGRCGNACGIGETCTGGTCMKF